MIQIEGIVKLSERIPQCYIVIILLKIASSKIGDGYHLLLIIFYEFFSELDAHIEIDYCKKQNKEYKNRCDNAYVSWVRTFHVVFILTIPLI